MRTGWLEEHAREGKIPHLQLAGSQGFTGGHIAAIVTAHEVLPTAVRDGVSRRPAPAWTTAEAAELLRCKSSWLEEKARRREIPSTRLSGAYHFSDAHLAEIVQIFEVRPRSKPAPRSRVPRGEGTAREPGQPVLKARPPRTRRGRASDRNP
jgi:hypothetical protein